MTARFSGVHLARVTIEALSPLSCGTGQEGLFDITLVSDANRLPMIPGASIQGVLRRLFGRVAPAEMVADVFGAVDWTGRARDARLIVGHALVHGAGDQPLLEFPAEKAIAADPLLKELAKEAPLRRDHVRLNHRHVADDTGKFDRLAVPAGTRFSLELLLSGVAGEAELVEQLVSLFAHPLFRPGGARARGYGRVRVVRAGRRWFPSSDPLAFRKAREASPADLAGFVRIHPAPHADVLEISVRLTPANPFRIGATGVATTTGSDGWPEGEPRPEHPPGKREKPVDMAPVREPRIAWAGPDGAERGEWRDVTASPGADDGSHLAPGSSLRGPLAHRALFHWNRLSGRFAGEGLDEAALAAPGERPAELEPLLGAVKAGNRLLGEEGRASALLVEDAPIGREGLPMRFALDHSSIDRLTGGVRATILFSEELLMPTEFRLRLVLDCPPPAEGDRAALAFLHALRDLAEGRLAIGARSLGFCVGGEPEFAGRDAGRWQALWEATARTPTTLAVPA